MQFSYYRGQSPLVLLLLTSLLAASPSTSYALEDSKTPAPETPEAPQPKETATPLPSRAPTPTPTPSANVESQESEKAAPKPTPTESAQPGESEKSTKSPEPEAPVPTPSPSPDPTSVTGGSPTTPAFEIAPMSEEESLGILDESKLPSFSPTPSTTPTHKPKVIKFKGPLPQLITSRKKGPHIEGLEWTNPADLEVITEVSGADLDQPFVRITGTFKNPDQWTIETSHPEAIFQWVESEKGAFILDIPVTQTRTALLITARGPDNKVEKEFVTIVVPPRYLRKKFKYSYSNFTVMAGLSYINYSENYKITGVSRTLTELAPNVKLGYQYVLGYFDLNINAMITTLPLFATSDIPGASATYLDANATVGLALPFIPKPWFIELGLGVYYDTMLVTNNEFGYKDQTRPSLALTVSDYFAHNYRMWGTVRLAPTNPAGGEILNLGSREIAGQVGWAHTLPGRKTLFITGDVSNFVITGTAPVQTSQQGVITDQLNITNMVYMLNVGLGF